MALPLVIKGLTNRAFNASIVSGMRFLCESPCFKAVCKTWQMLASLAIRRNSLCIKRQCHSSLTQCQQREAILASDILGMAGPGQKIAALVCCTVIRPGDMADNVLDRKKHPQWQGERTKMVDSFPSNEKGLLMAT